MKVICNIDLVWRPKPIHNEYRLLSLTKDKIYDVLDTGHIGGIPVYYIMKDNGARDWINQGNFITIEELRHNKLKELGI